MTNATGTKRKSATGQGGSKSKKTRQEDYTAAKNLIDALLTCEDIEDVEINQEDALNLASYARHLEGEVAEYKPKEKSASDISAAAEKLRAVTASGIQKQMSWKPSCKTGGAKYSYDGICSDEAVFASMLGLTPPLKWKMKKFTPEEFENTMGSVQGSARYNTLFLRGSVNLRYNAEEGTFKISGTYGV